MEHNLELGLFRWDAKHYGVDLRYEEPGQPTEIRPRQSEPIELDLAKLRENGADPQAYGEWLWKTIFADPNVLRAFEQAEANAARNDPATGRPCGLRVRLYVSPSVPELHAVRWETLHRPGVTSWLATSEATLFSRYLLSTTWRQPMARPTDAAGLRVALCVAAPDGLDRYRPNGEPLDAVDGLGELKRAREALAGCQLVELSSATTSAGSAPRRATLANIAQAIRDGADVLYLVCHGALLGQNPVLYLEKESGEVEPVPADDFLSWWGDLAQLPKLVVLISCQSAGRGVTTDGHNGGALAALGPRLVAAGVPAVIAMQGDFSMTTASVFVPTFFQELRRDGVVDRALAVARGAVRDKHDWWMPVLFMRLKSGRLWDGTKPAATGKFPHWDTLVARLRKGECTPIIGSGVLEPLIGNTRELAQRWAEIYRFPLAPQDRDDLPQVAQYLEVAKDRQFPRDELEYWLRQLLKSHLDQARQPSRLSVDDLFVAAGEALWARHDKEPHRLLARLPFPVYLTTNGDNLLARALTEVQVHGAPKKPAVRAFNADEEPLAEGFEATEATPLVYHLFGQWNDTSSLVLSENDYFEFLINITGQRRQIPLAVRRRLNKASLLFIGFRLDEWDFRVLTRAINALEGSSLLQGYSHVAVQVDPETSRFVDVENAFEYLQKHTRFAGKEVSVFWGKPEEFLSQLVEHWEAADD